MRNIRLVIEYDGSGFQGFAKQPGKRTVEGALEEAIEKVAGEGTRVIAASRTDSGVHALGQTVNFKTSSPIPADRFPAALRAILPEDMIIKSAKEEKAGFDSRRMAKKKKYSYFIFSGRNVSPIFGRYLWRVSPGLDISAMKKAARLLIGEKDFSSFAVTDKKRKLLKPVKKLDSIRFVQGDLTRFFGEIAGGWKGRAVRIDFTGDSFLYKMVRSIVGTLVDVGAGRIELKRIGEILRAGSRGAAGRTAPAKGLFLVKVFY